MLMHSVMSLISLIFTIHKEFSLHPFPLFALCYLLSHPRFKPWFKHFPKFLFLSLFFLLYFLLSFFFLFLFSGGSLFFLFLPSIFLSSVSPFASPSPPVSPSSLCSLWSSLLLLRSSSYLVRRRYSSTTIGTLPACGKHWIHYLTQLNWLVRQTFIPRWSFDW